MRRLIWTVWFAIGLYLLTHFVLLLDGWAAANRLPAANAYCNGNLLAELAFSRTPVCVANWLTSGKSWLAYAQTVLANVATGHIYVYEVLKITDILLFTTGLICFGFALACLWANAMTQGVLSTLGGLYTLSHGITRLQQRRQA